MTYAYGDSAVPVENVSGANLGRWALDNIVGILADTAGK
jgi:hypothetical protein